MLHQTIRNDDFLAQHSVATSLLHYFEWLQHCSNIATLCCSKNSRCESSRITSPSGRAYMHRAFKDRALIEPFGIAHIRSCLFPRGSSVLIFRMLSCSVVWLFTLFFWLRCEKKGKWYRNFIILKRDFRQNGRLVSLYISLITVMHIDCRATGQKI